MSTVHTGRSRQYAIRERLRKLGYVCHIAPGSKKIDVSAYYDGDGTLPRALSVEVGGQRKTPDLVFAELRELMKDHAVRHAAPLLAKRINGKWRFYVSPDEYFHDLPSALDWIREEAA